MFRSAIVATESQLGRSKNDTAITRPSLMKELAARRVRMTAQRRLLVGIIQGSPRHLDAATLLEMAKKQDPDIDRATVYRTIALLKDRGLIDGLGRSSGLGSGMLHGARQAVDRPPGSACGHFVLALDDSYRPFIQENGCTERSQLSMASHTTERSRTSL